MTVRGVEDVRRGPPRSGNALSRWLAGRLLALAGWRLEGTVPTDAKLLLVGAPHTSNLDFAITKLAAASLGVRVSWVGKKELFPPLLAPLVRRLGGVPVDRSASQSFVEAMVAEFGRREQFYLAVMPAGSRANRVGWRSGFYHIAVGASVPVFPVVFDWGQRTLRLGPAGWLDPDAGYEAELARVQAAFAGARGRGGTRRLSALALPASPVRVDGR